MHRTAKRDKNVNLAYKIHAIILLGSGWSLDEVVEALFLDDETLRNYVEKYKEGGLSKLAETNYKGSSSKLTPAQQEQLCIELDSKVQWHLYIEFTINSLICFNGMVGGTEMALG